MKAWIIFGILILGCMTYGQFAEEENDEDDGIIMIQNTASSGYDEDVTGADDENESGDNDEEEKGSYFDCGHFNLEICIQDYINHKEYDGPAFDEPLCWESFTTVACLHEYANQCFKDSEMKEDYLCKMKYFQDRILLLCPNETTDNDETELQEALKCLEGAEEDAQKCIEEEVPKMVNMLKEGNLVPSTPDIDSFKCMIMGAVLDCTVERLGSKEGCGEYVEAFREGADEAINEAMGDKCKERTITDVTSLK